MLNKKVLSPDERCLEWAISIKDVRAVCCVKWPAQRITIPHRNNEKRGNKSEGKKVSQTLKTLLTTACKYIPERS